MIVPVALAVAFAAGVDWRRLVLLAAAIYLPLVMGVLVVMVAWVARRQDDDRPALFCEGVASELRAGSSLRAAIHTAAASVGARVPALAPFTEIAAKVATEFSSVGDELRLTVVNAWRSGSDAAALFDEIGGLALAKAEIRREVRTATAPGRATALVLVGAPALYVTTQATSGGLGRALASGQQRYAAMVGVGLFLCGLAATLLVIWRSTR